MREAFFVVGNLVLRIVQFFARGKDGCPDTSEPIIF